jgi:hypothetical protein
MAMTTCTVTETLIALEPVTRDDFAASPASARETVPPTQRDLVALSLLCCPEPVAAAAITQSM